MTWRAFRETETEEAEAWARQGPAFVAVMYTPRARRFGRWREGFLLVGPHLLRSRPLYGRGLERALSYCANAMEVTDGAFDDREGAQGSSLAARN